MKNYLSLLLLFVSFFSFSQKFDKKISDLISGYENQVIELRHWFHENAELSNREFKTSERIAEELKKIGLNPQTGIAKTGVVALLKGGKPGPVVALRADIDGLPVKERADLTWASKMTGEYNGDTVPVMHACGHDTHTAIL
jgi:metal-dependent amidase/aminoacylase/carboxypeptidase family protein